MTAPLPNITSYTKGRKQIWEALHPSQKIAVESVVPPQSDSPMARPQEKGFAAATAESTGMTKQAINRHIARADALGNDALAKVANTSLDSGVELDALAKLDAPERAQLIERAVAGEQVSARAQTWEALHPEEQGGKTVPTLGGDCRREDRPGGVVSLQPTLHKTGYVSPRTHPRVEIIFLDGVRHPKSLSL